jgi:hypothetical protein
MPAAFSERGRNMSRKLSVAVRCSMMGFLIVTGCAGPPRRPEGPATLPTGTGPVVRTIGPGSMPAATERVLQSDKRTLTASPSPAATPGRTVPAQPMAVDVAPAALSGEPAPIWHVGDQWAFRWESSEGQGEYVWTVNRIEPLEGVEQYVIKSGPREIFYRARDLATTLETRSGAPEVRHVPPRLGFSWPLRPGTMWRQTLTEEQGAEPRAVDRTIAWKVEDQERIRVEAGTFDTLKIVARHERHDNPAVMYEMWYAPKVKQWVRLKEHFPSGIRYRELTDFALN